MNPEKVRAKKLGPLTKHEFEPYTVFDGTSREGDLSVIPALRGAEDRVGAWLSLVEHLVRDQGVGGSNPLAPTIFPLKNH